MTLEFLLTSLVVVLLPGTGVIYTLAIGLGQGFKASIAAAIGCTFCLPQLRALWGWQRFYTPVLFYFKR